MQPLLAFADSASGAETGVAIGLLLAYLVVAVAILGWYIWLLVDMLKYPDEAWLNSMQNKQLWVILWVVGLCAGISLIIGLIYQFAIRPKVRQGAGLG